MMLPVYFAQKAVVIHRDCLLAVRRGSTDPNQPGRWEIPGGRLENGETLDEHLVREVFEETSVNVQPGAPVFLWMWNIRQSDPAQPATIVAVARICTLVGGEIDSSHQMIDDHLDGIEWVPLSRLTTYEWIPNMLPLFDALRVHLRKTSS